MTIRLLTASFGLASILGLAGLTSARQPQDQPNPTSAETPKSDGTSKPAEPESKPEDTGKTKGRTKKSASTETRIEFATFGGGCFWCQEAVFERLPGVKAVISGYAGGNVPYPSYEQVQTGLTGHAEVVQIAFDPAVVSYEELLKVFWKFHDPTTLNRQGPDTGPQYRSIILYQNQEQKETAEKVHQKLVEAKVYRGRIVTELVPLTQFYPAEDYEQDYYRRFPYSQYSLMYIVPKVKKLKAGTPSPKAKAKAKAKPNDDPHP